jgi:NAD(P)-dependent dehydrogenase (short-subunit alcohol dehydrogenase family)
MEPRNAPPRSTPQLRSASPRETFGGRVALVTGAGGGMGHRIAADLAQAGARVFAVDAKEPPRDPDCPAGRYTYWRFDVTREARVAEALGEVFAACGRLDYVVNGAGVGWFDRDGSVATIDRGVWDRVLDVNLTAAMLVSRHALPLVRRTGGGAFVHLASVAGLRNADDPMDAYQVSKAGLISLSRALALQYGPVGIRSNTICPGAILTPMIQPLYDEDPARAGRMADRTPLRRLGTVADISSACRFLLSDDAAFITGVDLVVDGGWTLALA